MTAKDRAAVREQSLPFSECELETALVKERVSGPESLTPEERAVLDAFHGFVPAVTSR